MVYFAGNLSVDLLVFVAIIQQKTLMHFNQYDYKLIHVWSLESSSLPA